MRRRRQQGFIEVFILSVLALMSVEAEGHEGACEPALFVEVGTTRNPPYEARLWNEDGTFAGGDLTWQRVRSLYVAVSEIERIQARYISGIGAAGVQLTLDSLHAVLTGAAFRCRTLSRTSWTGKLLMPWCKESVAQTGPRVRRHGKIR